MAEDSACLNSYESPARVGVAGEEPPEVTCSLPAMRKDAYDGLRSSFEPPRRRNSRRRTQQVGLHPVRVRQAGRWRPPLPTHCPVHPATRCNPPHRRLHFDFRRRGLRTKRNWLSRRCSRRHRLFDREYSPLIGVEARRASLRVDNGPKDSAPKMWFVRYDLQWARNLLWCEAPSRWVRLRHRHCTREMSFRTARPIERMRL